MPYRKLFLLLALVLAILVSLGLSDDGPDRDWPVYLGDKASSQYSPLDQINRENVHELEVAWVYHTGDASENDRSQIQCNPLIVDATLYCTSPQIKAFALDAQTGEERWRFDPFAGEEGNSPLGVNRGVVYWADGEDRRILFTAGMNLYALDAQTGTPIESFGQRGSVDLRNDLGRDIGERYVLSNTPGIIYKDILILGTRVSEGPDAAPGHIRAYDVRTGEVRWVFRTIPQPGEYGYETWPENAYKTVGGANAWTGMALDEERGLVFIPTGSAAFDFYGGNRHGENLFANSLLALKADTGERVWHFQFVHHDLWDRDPPAPPNLVKVVRDGEEVDAVAQVTKSGHVFVFNRETGEPLFPIEERPVPPSDLEGEQAWPTQPFPTKPPAFARQYLREEDLTDISPESHAYVLDRFRQVRSGGPFDPPSKQGTIIFPGFDGGAEWGGAAHDPDTGLLYVNSNEMAWILTMVDVELEGEQAVVEAGARLYRANCAMCHGADMKGDEAGMYPSLVTVKDRYGFGDVMEILEHGRGVMPSFRQLPEADRDAIVNFLFGTEAVADPHEMRAEVEDEDAVPKMPYTITGYNRFLDQDGYPAVKPPWGTLNAIDLSEGVIKWTVPLGELPELTARGIPQTGTENYGGPVVTAGGLIFIGATKDEKFRAFDKDTGELLWETALPAGGYATPSTYMVDGRQYVVIAAGGGKMGTKSGDAYVAFALPD